MSWIPRELQADEIVSKKKGRVTEFESLSLYSSIAFTSLAALHSIESGAVTRLIEMIQRTQQSPKSFEAVVQWVDQADPVLSTFSSCQNAMKKLARSYDITTDFGKKSERSSRRYPRLQFTLYEWLESGAEMTGSDWTRSLDDRSIFDRYEKDGSCTFAKPVALYLSFFF